MSPFAEPMTFKEVAMPENGENLNIEDNSTETTESNSSSRMTLIDTTQYLAAIIVTLSAFYSGTFLSWSSTSLPILLGEKSNMQVDKMQGSWITALMCLGACFGAFPIGLITERFGRKMTLLSLAIPMTVSWLLITLSTSVYCYYVGRFVGGVAVGAISIAVPPYLAEMAQPGSKDVLGSLYRIQLASGILFGFLTGLIQDVKIISSVCSSVPFIYFIAFLFMPESPVYLMTQGKIKEAKNSLVYIRGIDCDIEKELNRIKEYIDDSISKEGGFKDLLSTVSNIRALMIAVNLMVFQQLGGIMPVIFYMGEIFSASGTALTPQIACVCVGIVQLAAVLVSVKYMENWRRRPVLICSSVIMGLSLALLGIYVHVDVSINIKEYAWIPIVCMSLFFASYSVGLGPIPWTFMNEIFPEHIKRRSIAISAGINWIAAFIVTKYYQNIIGSIGIGWMLWNFGTVCVIGALFIHLFVPETKGKSLEEIHAELSGHAPQAHRHIIELEFA